MVMGGDLCYKGSEFESRHHILEGHDFFHLSICCKICNVFEKTKINKKEATVGPFFKKELF